MYVVVKKSSVIDVDTIYDSMKSRGFLIKPRNNVLKDTMIKVDEMIIYNTFLVEKLVDKKCKRTIEKIISLLSFMYEDEDDTSGSCELILNEITHFRMLLEGKYQEYMAFEDYKLNLKKLEIIKNEVDLRRRNILETLMMNFEQDNYIGKKSGR